MLVPINLTGGSYRHKSLPLSAQTTRNFWPQKQEVGNEKSPYVLEPWCGTRMFGGAPSGACRGMTAVRGILYRVCGDKFYKVSSSGAHEELGSIAYPGRAIFDSIAGAVIFAVAGRAYVWDGSVLTSVTDQDLEAPDSVTALNNQAIWDGLEGRFAVSEPGNAGNIGGLNYASAESFTDDLVRVYAHNEFLYLFGTDSIEKWWNSGSGNPPFDRVSGGGYGLGLGALHSICSDETAFFYHGSDNRPYVGADYESKPLTGQILASEIARYADTSDAIGMRIKTEGQRFAVMTYPSADKTYVFPDGGDPFEWSAGIDGGRHFANAYAYCYGKHIISDYRNGNLYEMDFDAFTDNGDPIIRMRDSAPLHGGLFGKDGKAMCMNRLELICQTGVGLLAGQGSDPRIMLSFSDDGGRTFSPELFGSVGDMGNFLYRVEWFNLGTFSSRIIRLKTSDPVRISIHSAAADMEFGI